MTQIHRSSPVGEARFSAMFFVVLRVASLILVLALFCIYGPAQISFGSPTPAKPHPDLPRSEGEWLCEAYDCAVQIENERERLIACRSILFDLNEESLDLLNFDKLVEGASPGNKSLSIYYMARAYAKCCNYDKALDYVGTATTDHEREMLLDGIIYEQGKAGFYETACNVAGLHDKPDHKGRMIYWVVQAAVEAGAYEQALKAARSLEEEVYRTAALAIAAKGQFAAGKQDAAKKTFAEAEALARRSKDCCGELFCVIAVAQAECGMLKRAVENTRPQSPGGGSRRNWYVLSDAKRNASRAIIEAYVKEKAFDKALESARQAPKNQQEIALVAVAQGKAGMAAEAAKSIKEAFDLAERISDSGARSAAVFEVARISGRAGVYRETFERACKVLGMQKSDVISHTIIYGLAYEGYFKSASEAAAGIKSEDMRDKAYHDLCIRQVCAGELSDAGKSAEKIADSYQKAFSLALIAGGYLKRGDADAASKAYKKAIKAAEADPARLSKSLDQVVCIVAISGWMPGLIEQARRIDDVKGRASAFRRIGWRLGREGWCGRLDEEYEWMSGEHPYVKTIYCVGAATGLVEYWEAKRKN